MGSCGACATPSKNEIVRNDLRCIRGGSAASVHKLMAGLVRNAPKCCAESCTLYCVEEIKV